MVARTETGLFQIAPSFSRLIRWSEFVKVTVLMIAMEVRPERGMRGEETKVPGMETISFLKQI